MSYGKGYIINHEIIQDENLEQCQTTEKLREILLILSACHDKNILDSQAIMREKVLSAFFQLNQSQC